MLVMLDLPLEVLVCAVAEKAGRPDEHSPGPTLDPAAGKNLAPDRSPPNASDNADAALIARIARGDRHAFAVLYDRFSGPLYSTARHIVRDGPEAEDIVHDAYVSVWEKAATFDPARGSAFSWIVTLVRHRAIDRVRTRRRRAQLLADSAPADLGYREDAPAFSADAAAVRGDDARAVRAAVAALPPEQKRALELAFFSGLTQEQIAEKLQQPLGTVKARIRRGLLKLRDALVPRP